MRSHFVKYFHFMGNVDEYFLHHCGSQCINYVQVRTLELSSWLTHLFLLLKIPVEVIAPPREDEMEGVIYTTEGIKERNKKRKGRRPGTYVSELRCLLFARRSNQRGGGEKHSDPVICWEGSEREHTCISCSLCNGYIFYALIPPAFEDTSPSTKSNSFLYMSGVLP
jgi:hypothetical protein